MATNAQNKSNDEKTESRAADKKSLGAEINKVLVAFDGSAHAVKAFALAEDLAKKYHAQLVAVTVVELPMPYLLPEVPPVDLSASVWATVKRKEVELEELISQAKANGVDAKAEILNKGGSTVGQILDYADQEGVELIVAGTRGLGGFSRMLLGSVSTGLVMHASCPVLLVR